MVKQVPILIFSQIYFMLQTQSRHHNRRPQSNRKWFFTIQWPPEKVEVEYFAGLDEKILEITIKTAIFRVKFLHEEGLGVDGPINEKKPFLPKWLIELNLTLPNLALKCFDDILFDLFIAVIFTNFYVVYISPGAHTYEFL